MKKRNLSVRSIATSNCKHEARREWYRVKSLTSQGRRPSLTECMADLAAIEDAPAVPLRRLTQITWTALKDSEVDSHFQSVAHEEFHASYWAQEADLDDAVGISDDESDASADGTVFYNDDGGAIFNVGDRVAAVETKNV